ncbi:Copper-resistance protein [Trema orientale]|uniref:Copper-resistance protein n=1 Tax=Trema orientale TaxID=63057 RepID=A0A2P5CRT0_TREOI|nr:Copper-resistance protein [Trema orientale]
MKSVDEDMENSVFRMSTPVAKKMRIKAKKKVKVPTDEKRSTQFTENPSQPKPPGQTTNVLLTVNRLPPPDSSSATFVMAARPYVTSIFPFDNSTTAEKPPRPFDYTGVDPMAENLNTEFGDKIMVFSYRSNVEIVLQGMSFLNVENHPIHVHGHKFFLVGKGFGNFDIAKDPGKYNLVVPPERNTVAVPTRGFDRDPIQGEQPKSLDHTLPS